MDKLNVLMIEDVENDALLIKREIDKYGFKTDSRRRNNFVQHTLYEVIRTEPEYFKSFPVNTETKVEAIGIGRSKTALVEKALELLRITSYNVCYTKLLRWVYETITRKCWS